MSSDIKWILDVDPIILSAAGTTGLLTVLISFFSDNFFQFHQMVIERFRKMRYGNIYSDIILEIIWTNDQPDD